MKPSDEQTAILEQVGRALQDQMASPPVAHGIIVDAVAGSGKTTTVLLLAALFPDVDVVQITYNAKLKQEVRQKANLSNLTKLEIHTYHSLALKLYGGACQTDEGIVNILRNNMPLKKGRGKSTWATPQIVVLDEVQDSTVLLYSLMQKIMVDVYIGRPPPIVMYFGDCMQGVYQFKGADPRYLTLADQLDQNGVAKIWTRLSLSTTFRLTEPNAWFVNHVMLGLSGSHYRLRTTKPGPPLTYVYLDAYTSAGEFLCTEIIRHLNGSDNVNKLKPEDIMVIAPSIKHPTSPIRRLEHSLVMRGVPCYVPVSDDAPIRENLSIGKVLFSSFHQSKGLERECVIMYGFDGSYFRYFARDQPVDKCPPTQYVGATRPMNYMYVVHHMLEPSLPFVRMSLREIAKSKHVRFIGSLLPTNNVIKSATSNFIAVKNTTVTDLVQFLSVDASAQLTELCNRLFISVYPSGRTVSLANTVTGKDQLCETVSDVNGLVLTAMYECTDNVTEKEIYQEVTKEHDLSPNNKMSSIHRAVLTPGFARDNGFFQRAFSKITQKTSQLTISEHMYIGLLYTAVTDDLYCRLAQISQYDWINEETAEDVLTNMATHLPPAHTLQFECLIGCDAYLQTESVKSEPSKKSYTLPIDPEYYVPVNNFVMHHFGPKFGKVLISGRLDVCDDATVWELKCVDQIRLEHKLQLAVYAFLWRKTVEPVQGPRVFRLFNIRTEEIWELASDATIVNTKQTANSDETNESSEFLVDRIMVTLLRNKYPEEIVRTDSEFVNHCLNYRVSGTIGRSLNRMTLGEAFIQSESAMDAIYMVLDTETTGFSANDYIIQLSYVVCNSEFTVLRQYDELVTVSVEIKNTFVHGITNEMCRTHGRSFDRIARDTFWRDLQHCTHIVCHNAEFDMRMLKSSLERYQCTEQINMIAQKKVICTMNDPLTIEITNAKTTNAKKSESSNKPKPPTLAELYTTVTGKQMHNAHNALHDVLNLCTILKKLWIDRNHYLKTVSISMEPDKIEPDNNTNTERKKMRQTTLSFKKTS